MNTTGIVDFYLNGNCDALAIALASHFECGIKTLHSVRRSSDGTETVGKDFIHAFIELPDLRLMDARGIRSMEEILKDFRSVIDMLEADEGPVSLVTRDHETAADFIQEAGVDPYRSLQAYEDALSMFSDLLDPDLVEMTKRELLTICDPDEEDGYAF
jgi:hypothetical protein